MGGVGKIESRFFRLCVLRSVRLSVGRKFVGSCGRGVGTRPGRGGEGRGRRYIGS